MPNFTEKAICNSFVKLLNEKPLKQITVKDIVDDCGLNRNTFYYHFSDIPELIERIIKEDAERIIFENKKITSIKECINAIISFALKNRKAVLHIYRSVNRDIYEQYQWHICEYISTIFVEERLNGRIVSNTDKKVIIQYLKCMFFGILIDWLETGMKDGIHAYIDRISELKQGDFERIINRCEKI